MGDVANYDARVSVEIDIAGKDELEVKNIISFGYNLDYDKRNNLVKKIMDILKEYGLENVESLEVGRYEDYYTRIEDDTFESLEEFINDALNTYDFGNVVIELKKLKGVDKSLYEKAMALKEKYDLEAEIINNKVYIHLLYASESIYCENDNSDYDEIDGSVVLAVLQEFPPERIKLIMEADGDAYC